MTKNNLMVGDDIVLHGMVGENMWEAGFTAKEVLEALAEKTGPITVRINSGGGYATDGAAIYSALNSYNGKVTIRVEGIAASAASLIAMAGDELIMDDASLFMIHDPRGLSYGTHRDHKKTAEDLEKMTSVYARIYAQRTGVDIEKVKQLMEDETWMTADEAIAQGFATSKDTFEEEFRAVAQFDFSIYAKTPQHLREYAKQMGWDKSQLMPPETAPHRAAAPASKEAVMTVNNPAAANLDPATTVTPPVAQAPAAPTVPAIDPVAARRDAVTARFGDTMTARQVEEIAKSATDPADALMKAANIVIDAQMKGAGPEIREPAKILSDEGEREVDAMIGALSSSMFGTKLEGASTKYRGLTMKKLAIHLAGNQGFAFNDVDLVKKGMLSRGAVMVAAHSTSDFAFITAELMNRQLRAAYNSRPGTWNAISRLRTAADFRTLYSVQSGVDTEMRKVTEDGEYESTVIGDTGESFRVERFGRKVLLSFEAVINDDLGAFARLPGDFARGARNLESRIAWGLINGNAVMSDAVAFFATGRTNLAGTNAAITATSVGAARAAMMQQRPFGASSTGSDFMEANPDLLYVPPALEIAALQFAANTVPATDATTNPFKGTLTPVVEPRLGAAVVGGSNTAWYLFDSTLPPMEHAYLQGYEAPMVETIDRMDPDGVTMIARHIFGAGLVEPRGAYKNIGV